MEIDVQSVLRQHNCECIISPLRAVASRDSLAASGRINVYSVREAFSNRRTEDFSA